MTHKAALTRIDAPPNPASWTNKIGNSLIVFAWLVLNNSALQWLVESSKDISVFNLVIVSVVATVLSIQALHHRRKLGLTSTPTLQLVPLVLMFGSAVSAISLQWLLDIPQVSVLLFALGTYGLIGLFIAPSVWHKGLPAAVFAACILPFSAQFGLGLGFPVRVITAQIVERILAFWQIAAISSHDIIVLENSAAQIDLPCSGLRSLWTGTLFLLAATWLENRQIKFRWLLVCAANILLLMAANVGRILLLVLVTNVFDRPDLGHILHVPLGLVGFITAGLFSWLLLQTVPRHQDKTPTRSKPSSKHLGKRWSPLTQQIVVFSCILALALIPHPQKVTTSAIASIALPTEMHVQPLQLTATEKDFFANYEGSIAQKSRFLWHDIPGSILFVSSNSVQAYHAPELCFVGNGFKVDKMQKKQLSPQVLGRWLSINNGTMSAAYWFQSPQHTTDDFLTQLWGRITRKDRLWVMASVLFEQPQQADTPEIKAFTTKIHDAVASSLTGV
jgi:exosortase O